ncbi:hypothetical protein A5819_000045 [Enterococcus sp. 7E2_DIV0204]|uniref:hypothetical protein n=1 Tax=unclassified Enterococcus TaxID=2608891 RepID=UPI000A35BEF3|nr:MULTISPECIES: hypothetical protein [unclassified Enterococcus]OTN87599.1 hypothetical protein A5819_000045 [Enterococcus sp. 7E2_DIV0204]OTP46542.1 hypothetical protein A5884_003798 [Enterococcus sp. 7D2_DIV0200]OTP49715.1 hypothetical protein A5884_002915 [Enterococcus sp. 7D2_DIV0200]
MDVGEAKEENMKSIESSQKEFDRQFENLTNRINKYHKHMNSTDYRELAEDIHLLQWSLIKYQKTYIAKNQ